ncbi:MAG: glucose 1-dehydrogenase [Dehalococcoidia bacterium]|nr:glucose 1-dehydrogenase [Dehalococcoidia bacterium]
MLQLEGRSALVTGAGRGIGRAIAIGLAEQGASLLVTDVNLDAVEGLAGELGEGRAIALRADVSDLTDVDRMVERCATAYGSVDILVNNAAVTRFADVMRITPGDWDNMHSVNARGTFFTMQRAAREMISSGRGGRIVNIASIAGKGFSGTSNAAYAASKGAVIAMTAIAAHQLGPHGINVNSVCPGLTRTPLGDDLAGQAASLLGMPEKQFRKEREATIPIGRECRPEEIAAMVAFLVGPGGDAITGQAINVDGGILNF